MWTLCSERKQTIWASGLMDRFGGKIANTIISTHAVAIFKSQLTEASEYRDTFSKCLDNQVKYT